MLVRLRYVKIAIEIGADGIGESPQVVRYQGMLMLPSCGSIADELVRRCNDVNHTAGERYPTIDGTPHSYQAQSTCRHAEEGKANEQERPHARLRDYLTIAPTLGVSHMLAFSLTDAANVHMRVARLPQGPTLTFRVQRYSLVKWVNY